MLRKQLLIKCTFIILIISDSGGPCVCLARGPDRRRRAPAAHVREETVVSADCGSRPAALQTVYINFQRKRFMMVIKF